ncbi:leucine-rich repeat-containing protein 1 [Toxorhynchites rutilus septentrionalis]|uniref:leucine-rich repeat-containing protein 1 n=1 Tax=Toxorhynchites rutilus septentrionalis TaxID=329112 RepID=UPI0024783DE3|nr:leucine-rich repeat-containing protein 1 [Toxorhynchites rutilus septentrionalis]
MTSSLLSQLEDQIRTQYVHFLVDKCVLNEDKKISLVRLKLRTIPPGLVTCSFLAKLSLDCNLLSSESIVLLQSFKFLQYLTLNDNELTLFPEELCQLKFVKFLNIGDNPIERLPAAIGKLKNLITLWCNDMLLDHLPEEITALRKLKTFGVRNNKLTHLPESFGTMRRLKWLSLSNNRLHKLPSSFSGLGNLRHLNMEGNQFEKIPMEITKLASLSFCSFANNLIEELSPELLNSCRFIGTLQLDGNPVGFTHIENTQPRGVIYNFDLLDTDITEDWVHSLPNSEMNSTETSADETETEPRELHLTKLARFGCAV